MDIDNELLTLLKVGPRRREMLRFLVNSSLPMSSRDLARELNIWESNVIRILGELEDKEAVICVTPKRRRNRQYEATEKGKGHLSALEKSE